MKLLYILAILPTAASVSSVKFSYKPDSDNAPNAWPGIFLGDDIENQCGGSKQSGIDIPTHQCDVFDDYVFEVSGQEWCVVSGKGWTPHFCAAIFYNSYLCHRREDRAPSMTWSSK